jgi:hypothetical protein
MKISEHQLFNRNLDIADLALQLPGLASRDASSDDRPGHVACTSKGCFRRNEHVGNILQSAVSIQQRKKEKRERTHLFLAKKGKVQKNFEGLSICGEDDELRYTTVKGLSGCKGEHQMQGRGGRDWTLLTFIRAFFQLFVLTGLLDQVQDLRHHNVSRK